jgi:DNA repair protein RadC
MKASATRRHDKRKFPLRQFPTLTTEAVLANVTGLTLEEVGTFVKEAGGMRALATAEPERLASAITGMDSAQWRFLMARELQGRLLEARDTRLKTSSPRVVADYLCPRLGLLSREVFHVLCFNAANQLLEDVRVAEGSMSSCPVEPQTLFRAVLMVPGTTAIIIAHNHPSGFVEASVQDLGLTKLICEGAKLLGIKVLDHIIVGGNDYLSFTDARILPTDVRSSS